MLDAAAQIAPHDDVVGFCALTHDLGKALTPPDELPRHVGHEQRGVAPLRELCARLKVPTEHAALAELVCREHLNTHRAFELKPATVLKLLGTLDALRRPARLEAFLAACTADRRGRRGHENADYPQAAYLREAQAAAAAVRAEPFVAQGLTGPAIGAAMDAARVRAITALKTNHSPSSSAV